MAKAPQIAPNTPEDVILRLSQRQAGVSVTQGLLDDIQGIIDSEGALATNSLRWQQLERISDLIMALTGALQPPRPESTPEQEAEATEKLQAFADSPAVTVQPEEAVVTGISFESANNLGHLHHSRRGRPASGLRGIYG